MIVTGENISIQNSTVSAKGLIPWIESKYSIPQIVSSVFYRKSICDTYFIGTLKQNFYLKIYFEGRRTRLHVTEEVRMLNYVLENGVSVVKPVQKKDRSYVSELKVPEGLRYAVLFEEAEGVEESNDSDRIRAFGEMMSRFHLCSDRMPGEYQRKQLNLEHLIDENMRVIIPLMAHREKDLQTINNIAEYCADQVQQSLPTTKPEFGICHGDLFGGDVRYKTDNTPVILDFDSSGVGWRAVDIGVYLTTPDWMDTSDKAEKLRQQQMSVFLQGYSENRQLSENELSIIQITPAIHHIFLMGHTLRYNAVYEGNFWANDDFIDWHMKWFNHWVDSRSLINER